MSDEKQIDDSDIQQASPAQAEAEVTDPDGREGTDDTDAVPTPGVLGVGVIGGAAGNLGNR